MLHDRCPAVCVGAQYTYGLNQYRSCIHEYENAQRVTRRSLHLWSRPQQSWCGLAAAERSRVELAAAAEQGPMLMMLETAPRPTHHTA